jgi:hypothetical protein
VEKNVRLRKECKIKVNSSNFSSKFGIMNRMSPNVIYIKINSWLEYLGDFKDYSSYINNLNSTIKVEFKTLMNKSNIFDNVFIYTPNTKKNIIINNKKFHASFEFTIKQKEPISKDIDFIKKEIELVVNNIIEKIEKDTMFKYKLTKG